MSCKLVYISANMTSEYRKKSSRRNYAVEDRRAKYATPRKAFLRLACGDNRMHSLHRFYLSEIYDFFAKYLQLRYVVSNWPSIAICVKQVIFK